MRTPSLIALFTVLVSACTTPIATQSGQPEFTVTAVRPECVHSTVLSGLVDQGYVVRSATPAQIVAGRPTLGAATALLAAGEERRITVLLIPIMGGVRVVANEAFVSNAGSGFEQVSPIYPTQEAQDRFASNAGRIRMVCGG